jgi:tetraacyldisaccharide 4'-kinase
MFLHRYALDVIEGRKPGKSIFYLLSLLYRQVIVLRHAAYDRGWVKVNRVSVPVVSIGNIVSGGTGKTPLIHFLARELSKQKQVAILSRGYRSQAEKGDEGVRVTAASSAEQCGDEPVWLASKLPQTQVWVGKDRSASAKRAIEAGANLILLDDGMQHRKLHRDLQIVVMDATDLFGKGDFLPRGYLRDLPERLETADLIVVNHAEEGQDLATSLKPYTTAPIVTTRLRLKGDFKGKKVGVFCGIGNPNRFLAGVEKLGAQVVYFCFTLDHTIPTLQQLETFANRCRDQKAELLLCTEKDLVKLPSDMKLALPVQPVEAEIEIVEGQSYLENLLERMKS